MKQLDVGVNTENVCILLYADDVILIADSEDELQTLHVLDCLHRWCERNCLNINKDKSKIIHFRRQSSLRSNVSFTCGDLSLDYVSHYK